MMRPWPLRTRGMKAWVISSTPKTLVSKSARISAMSSNSSGPPQETPALLNSPTMPALPTASRISA